MRIRRVIITKNCYIARSENLRNEPSVRKYWPLPLEYALFEPYHPVFERIYDNDVRISNAARMEEQVKLDLAAAISGERKLLAPLYHKITNPSQALILLVPSKTAMYHFVGEGKGQIRWPNLGCFEGWELSTRISVQGQLLAAIPETLDGLQTIIGNWFSSMKNLKGIKDMQEVSLHAESFAFKAECSEASGDAAMALFALLTETQNITSVQSITFAPAQ